VHAGLEIIFTAVFLLAILVYSLIALLKGKDPLSGLVNKLLLVTAAVSIGTIDILDILTVDLPNWRAMLWGAFLLAIVFLIRRFI
jgi:hypothetical protein